VDKLRSNKKSAWLAKDTSTVTRWLQDIGQVGYLNENKKKTGATKIPDAAIAGLEQELKKKLGLVAMVQ